MERELSAVVGRKVDLRTPDELSRYFRENVLKAARVQYVRE
jgi:predicted nucleotidyltransferase